MKISKSKQELARIISENGGWRDGAEFAAQDKYGEVFFYYTKPTKRKESEVWHHSGVLVGDWIECERAMPNWHQTILSRAKYFHIYPATDAKPEFCESMMGSIPGPIAKPTIEQLAADCRSSLDFALRKQQEADASKADADEKLRVLAIAGEALGLLVSPITTKQEPELVITDRRGFAGW